MTLPTGQPGHHCAVSRLRMPQSVGHLIHHKNNEDWDNVGPAQVDDDEDGFAEK